MLTLKDVNFFEKINQNKPTINNKDNSRIKASLLKELENKKKILDGLVQKLALVDSNLANIVIDKMETLNENIKELQSKIDLLEKKKEISLSYNKEDLNLKEKNRKHFIKEFENMDMQEKQTSIRKVINKITWTGENIIIS